MALRLAKAETCLRAGMASPQRAGRRARLGARLSLRTRSESGTSAPTSPSGRGASVSYTHLRAHETSAHL
eukprot:14519138-Alexandrium_andersonii.AAC.1